MELLQDLNEAQRLAVTSTEGYIRVVAGAGSGKTRALAHRYAWLVQEMGILPENILCATFTNKAANEMRKRVRSLVGDFDTGYISTFHSFCVTVLQEDISALQYPKSFLVLDNADIDAMLAAIYEERGLSMRDMTFSHARDMIEMEKLVRQPEYYKPMLSLSPEELRQKYLNAVSAKDIIFWGYLYQEKKCFALDYNDLLKFVLYIFQIRPEIYEKWSDRLEYIMVDEYQDIDEIQYKLMKALCRVHGNLFIVGDPDQTIYTWRGASVRFLLDFEKDFPNVKTIMMNDNYRSTPQILSAANSLIDKNTVRMKKSLRPVLGDGPTVLYHHARTAAEEADWIARQIRQLEQDGARLSEVAILYRAHYLSRPLEDALLRERIAYTLYSGAEFFSRREVKDALAYLRLAVYRDDLSLARVINEPKRNIGRTRMQALRRMAEEGGITLYQALMESLDTERFRPTGAAKLVRLVEQWGAEARSGVTVSELLDHILDESGYEAALRLEGSQARLDNLAELRQCVHEYEVTCGEECTPEGFIRAVALMTDTDALEGTGKVRLMTVHTAKGLEFPYVFLCGLDEGIFPSKKTATRSAMEEERRLAFVAFTRAERRLFLSDCEGRNLDGSPRYPSRFIFNVERDLLEYTNELPSGLEQEALAYIETGDARLADAEQPPALSPGDRVRHAIMGDGTVLDVDSVKSAYTVQFDGLATARRIIFRAKLDKIT